MSKARLAEVTTERDQPQGGKAARWETRE